MEALAADDGHPVRDVQAQSIDAGDGLVDQRDHRVHRRFQQAHQRVERAAEYLLYAFPCLGPVPGEYARDESDQPVKYGLDTFQDGADALRQCRDTRQHSGHHDGSDAHNNGDDALHDRHDCLDGRADDLHSRHNGGAEAADDASDRRSRRCEGLQDDGHHGSRQETENVLDDRLHGRLCKAHDLPDHTHHRLQDGRQPVEGRARILSEQVRDGLPQRGQRICHAAVRKQSRDEAAHVLQHAHELVEHGHAGIAEYVLDDAPDVFQVVAQDAHHGDDGGDHADHRRGSREDASEAGGDGTPHGPQHTGSRLRHGAQAPQHAADGFSRAGVGDAAHKAARLTQQAG